MMTLLLASLLLTPIQAPQAPAPPVIAIPAADITQDLRLNDGSRVIGRVESVDGDRFTFRTTSGVLMTIDSSTVMALKPLRGEIVNGELWNEDSNATRLFFAPTGRSLRQGEAYFGVYEVYMPFIQFGITDRLSFGGGTPFLWLGGEGGVPVWVTPKLQVLQTRSTAASVGVMHIFNAGDANAGIAYTVVTQGNTNNAVTFGAGYAYTHGGDSDGNAMVGMIGGERRVSRRTKLVTENYLFPGGGFVSGGVRFLGEKLSADFGFVIPLFGDFHQPLPMINIVKKF